MRKLLLSGAFMLSCCTSVLSQELIFRTISSDIGRISEAPAVSNQMHLGYCGDEIVNEVGYKPNSINEVAVQFPAEMLDRLKGNKLVEVLVGTGSDIGKENKIFLTYDLDGEPFYEQTIEDEFAAKSWNKVVLDTPYEIEGKEFFIVYHVKASNVPNCYTIGLDEGPAVEYGDWLRFEKKGEEPVPWFHIGEGGAFTNVCLKGVIEGDKLPKYDLMMKSVSMDGYVAPGTPFSISGVVSNMAVETIDNFDISIKIGDEEPIVKSYSDVGLANGKTYKFEIDDIVIDQIGSYEVVVSVENPNGQTDEDPENNYIKNTIKCTTDYFSRKVLLEQFTTADCPNCPKADWLIDDAIKTLGAEKNIIRVSHHAGYTVNYDKFQIQESILYLKFYYGNIYAPAIMLDRTNLSDYGAQGATGAAPGPVFLPNDPEVLKNTFTARLEEKSYVELFIEKSFEKTTRELKLKVTGRTSRDDIALNDYAKLVVYLTEDSLVAYQSSAPDPENYVHNHVIRDVVSDVWGDQIEFSDYMFSKTYTYSVSQDWKSDNMNIVAYLYNKEGEGEEFDVNNCEVYNAATYKLSDVNNLSVEETVEDGCDISVVDGQVILNREWADVYVYSMSGMLVKHLKNTSSFELEEGLYIVRLTEKENTVNKKILVTY